MTDEEMKKELNGLAEVGFVEIHGEDSYSLTDAGRDYFESVMHPNVEERHHIYALGRLQGIRETKPESP